MDNGIKMAFAIEEQNNFNLRLCDAHIEGNDIVLTPTEYSGRQQLVIKRISDQDLDKIEQDGSLIIAECKNNKEFGDIVEIKLS